MVRRVDAKIRTLIYLRVYRVAVEFTAGTSKFNGIPMRVGVDPAGYVDINGNSSGGRVFGGKSFCTSPSKKSRHKRLNNEHS